MNYGYIRVSSDRQTVENQRFEITNFCRIKGICMSKECKVWTIKDGYRLGEDIQSKYKLSGKEAYIRRQLKRGTSLREIARRCHVDRHTLNRYIAGKM